MANLGELPVRTRLRRCSDTIRHVPGAMVAPDELAQFCELLKTFLSSDNRRRKEAEQVYQAAEMPRAPMTNRDERRMRTRSYGHIHSGCGRLCDEG